MHERMTVEEAKRRYPDEHIAFAEYETAPNGAVLSGVLVAHAAELRDMHKVTRAYRDLAIFWTGEIVSPLLWAFQRRHVER